MNPTFGKRIHEFFEIGVILKGLNAAAELLLGILFLFVNVSGIIQKMIGDELIEDPDNFLARHLHSLTAHFTPQAEYYSAIYLISHGIIKIFLVFGLLRGYVWSYPASLAVLVLFVVYQCMQILMTFSIGMIALTVFDLIVMWLIWEEWTRVTAGKKDSVEKA
ncbi:MAG: DUF2127 domain-containing protein [Candidatus Pacebacteria bacterium]|nr:DUF2127 domain-containing protein [Candidatus Paceibacterota bacterium]